MKSLSSIFWILVLALIIYVGFKVVPIYYRGIFGISGVCKENADVYHIRPNRAQMDIYEKLAEFGIPKEKSEVSIIPSDDKVVITITYDDSATFFDRYTRDFHFESTCDGVLRSYY